MWILVLFVEFKCNIVYKLKKQSDTALSGKLASHRTLSSLKTVWLLLQSKKIQMKARRVWRVVKKHPQNIIMQVLKNIWQDDTKPLKILSNLELILKSKLCKLLLQR